MKRLGAAGQGQVALAIANASRRQEHLDQSAGAGRRMAQPWTGQAKAVGHGRTCSVGKPLMPPGYITRFRSVEMPPLFVEPACITHVAADGAGKAMRINLRKIDARVGEGLLGHAQIKRY